MNITPETRLSELMNKYPWLLNEAVKIDERFKMLNNPIGMMFISTATIKGLSDQAGLTTDEVIGKIEELIANHKA